MAALLGNTKTILAIAALGLLLGGCNRNSGSDTSQSAPPASAPSGGTNAPPAAPEGNAPPAAPGATAPSSGAAGVGAAVGAMVDDATITTKVKAALLADADVKGSEINVETTGGQVTLSGSVASQAQIDKAATIARGIEGVKNVDNKLTVKAG